jgi:hypothetical protein
MNTQTRNKGDQPRTIVSVITSAFFIISIFYVLINSVLADILIKKAGQCTKAVIYKSVEGGRTAPNFAYRFDAGHKVYHGMISKLDSLSIGDSVCVIYYTAFPSFNRPVSYFSGKRIICKCQ